MLHAKALSKRYGKTVAVERFDLDIPIGRIVGLVGNNGAGKTTTIKMLCGIVEPTSGTVEVADGNPLQPKVRASIGFLPEASPLYDELTPMAYMEFFGRLHKLEKDTIGKRTAKLFAELRLDEVYWKRPIGQLSKGSARKVAIARALLHEPRVLILDEPTSGLDPQSRRDLDRVLLARRDAGAAIVLSAHDLRQVEELCDEVRVMNAGRIVTGGTLRELREQWGTTTYQIRANKEFKGSTPDGPLHVVTCDSWVEAKKAITAAGDTIVDIVSEPPKLEDILARAAI